MASSVLETSTPKVKTCRSTGRSGNIASRAAPVDACRSGSTRESEARANLQTLLEQGVRAFAHLTDKNELLPYAHLLPPGIVHQRIGVPDVTCPTPHSTASCFAGATLEE